MGADFIRALRNRGCEVDPGEVNQLAETLIEGEYRPVDLLDNLFKFDLGRKAAQLSDE